MASLAHIRLADLHFDPQNPRLPEHLKHAPESDVLEYLLLETGLIELMLSIGQQDFFIGEPLLVSPSHDGKTIIVVEGNRRLAALKLLHGDVQPTVMPGQVKQAREMATFRPDNIPCLKFRSRDEILTYLGYRHITGIKEWEPLAKARYLKQLREKHGPDHAAAHRELAKEIGSKSSHVAKLLTGLSLIERARDIGILNKLRMREDDIPFSLLTTGIGYPGICSFIGISGSSDVEIKNLKEENFKEFFSWVFEKTQGKTTLGESRNFDKLNRVLLNPTACDELRRGASLESADIYTSGPLETFRKFLKEAEDKIANASNALSKADGINESDSAQAHRLRTAAIALAGAIHAVVSPE